MAVESYQNEQGLLIVSLLRWKFWPLRWPDVRLRQRLGADPSFSLSSA